jgi:hypothetical protein
MQHSLVDDYIMFLNTLYPFELLLVHICCQLFFLSMFCTPDFYFEILICTFVSMISTSMDFK